MIGFLSGVILHSSWEETNLTVLPNPIKRRELSLNVANRLLDWPGRKSAHVESRLDSIQSILTKEISDEPADYSSFRPKTAFALDSLTDAIIRDYVNYWYEPILPSETAFPRSCRCMFTGFVKSMASHLARKRTTDTFLEFLTNSSSIMIVFLNELANAFENVGSSTKPEEIVRRYLEKYPESSLANVLADPQQRKKLNIIADDILSSFMDTTAYGCAPLRTFCREILCGVVLESTISSLSRPECINSWIIHLFSEGESEIMNAIDAGVEGVRNQGVTAAKRPIDAADAPRPTSSDSFDTNLKSPGRTYQEKSENADKATKEAITEAKRLSALIAAQDLQSGSTDSNTWKALVSLHDEDPTLASSTSPRKEEGEFEPAKRQEDPETFPEPSNACTRNETSPEPRSTLSSPMQEDHSSHQNLEQHLSLPPLTLHRAYISVDDGSESSDALVRSKPTFNYMLQVEPTSSQRTGWMVFRTYKDFELLHEILAAIARLNKLQFADTYSLLPTWKGLTNRALVKSLEQYLQAALQHEPLAECEKMRRFLGKEGPVDPEIKNASTKPGFFPTQAALENVGRGVLGALTNAPRGVSSGSKTVFSGMTGVFGANPSKKPSPTLDADSAPLKDSVQSSDKFHSTSQNNQSPGAENAPASRSGVRIPATQSPLSGISHACSPTAEDSLVDSQAKPIHDNSAHALLNDAVENLETRHHGLAENVSCLDETLEKLKPNGPSADQASPTKDSIPGNKITTISYEETQVAIELIFAVINELYTLSSAWNIRRTLLNAAKSYILRPGNPNLETIRDLLQNSMIDANTSDEAIGHYLMKLRENALPTKSELDSWPASPNESEKERLRERARRVFLQKGLPQALTSVMGAAASREALEKVFDCLQVHSVARGFPTRIPSKNAIEDIMVSEVRKRMSGADDSPVHGEHSQPKRTKTGSVQSAAPDARFHIAATWKTDSNGDKYWEISKMRRVMISTFRGKTMVSIREYYEKDGQELPGKKGISLPLDQYASLVTLLPEIEVVLKEQGQSIPRPEYTSSDSRRMEGCDSEDDEELADLPKKNIEATSDEDEDED
ncbi:PX domain protein [Aspergillus affinis]|uniref:PX domain protein n=1 Tax=Aspergillus affinis TaxID=1070780 RepID=UPI0022FE183F|nr:uncharacterized protein KD926_004811 [Aspergillus affinis]KAI9035019.1 hypothetical protein KD926_004811 [Aspergillus affinis]